eukprot:TRINITY_DN31018_c0_g1_i1.p1 TRINITY_DN31018_c0_g1~~TRINITY_DN31018_c0_g1_i1.p1  ORF type:complete len:398 (+),score=14.83 TRINITY_DN31018_c0_g1_i1:104-1297(+)
MSRLTLFLATYASLSIIAVRKESENENDPSQWVIQKGDCSIVYAGRCVASPNFPDNYDSNEHCIITPPADQKIDVVFFDTEDRFDWLKVNGIEYSGKFMYRPRDDRFRGDIEWSSDGAGNSRGWQLCMESPSPPPSPSPPAPSLKDVCGFTGDLLKSTSSDDTRVVNGFDTSTCQWRWQAYVGAHGLCGGSLVSDRWILTAAHCVNSTSEKDITVKLGLRDLDQVSHVYRVRRIVTHHKYEPRQVRYDFALLELDEVVEFSDCIGPVCLPEADEDATPGSKCIITGWGSTHDGGPASKILQEATVSIKSKAECEAGDGKLNDEMFCAGGSNDSAPTDSCHGDSGGPLVCYRDRDRQRYVLQGVTSWGVSGCGEPGKPTVYARVHEVRDWLSSTMRGH